jgi:hypothetical protein
MLPPPNPDLDFADRVKNSGKAFALWMIAGNERTSSRANLLGSGYDSGLARSVARNADFRPSLICAVARFEVCRPMHPA